MNDVITPPVSIRGITEQDYLRWRHNPVSQWFLQYLRDYRADLLVAAQEMWLADNPEWKATEGEMKGWARCLSQMADLPFASMQTFYQQIDAEEEDDASSDVG